MPRLTVTDVSIAEKILSAAEESEEKNQLQNEFQKSIQKHRMTADDCLETLGMIMKNGKKDANRISVARVGLEINGFLNKKEEESGNKAPVIQFVFSDSTVNLTPMLNPSRMQSEKRNFKLDDQIVGKII